MVTSNMHFGYILEILHIYNYEYFREKRITFSTILILFLSYLIQKLKNALFSFSTKNLKEMILKIEWGKN